MKKKEEKIVRKERKRKEIRKKLNYENVYEYSMRHVLTYKFIICMDILFNKI